MNTTLTIMAVVIVLAFVAAVTIAYPALEAHASNSISDSRNKGQQGNSASGGKRHHNGGCGTSCGG